MLLTQCSTTEPQEHPTFEAQCYIKAIKVQEECFQPFFKYIFYIKIWHAASNNGINLFKIIVINNRNYNLKGIIDNYNFCHNRAALSPFLLQLTHKQEKISLIICLFLCLVHKIIKVINAFLREKNVII